MISVFHHLNRTPAILLAILMNSFVYGQHAEIMLIRNARLIDRADQSEDKIINILINDKILKIISVDEILVDESMVGYNARQGIILGNLNIGAPANFMILARDPREDINVLLDTKQSVIFAIKNGVVEKNELYEDTEKQTSTGKKIKTRWLSYTPPPMALPLSYEDKTKWNRWDTKAFSGILLVAAAVDRQLWLNQNSNSNQQVGELSDFDGGEIRAFRFGIAGTINFKKPWIYTLMGATHAFDKGYNSKGTDKFTILDYRLDIPIWNGISMSVGKQKEPISMERLQLGTQMQMQERSAIGDAVNSVRNVGITVNGTAFKQRSSWAVGVFNDWFEVSKRFNENSTQLIGRVTGLIWIAEDESNLFHLGVGFRYDNGKDLIRYQASPEFNQSPVFVDTDSLAAASATTLDIEFSWREGPFWLSAEYIRNSINSKDLIYPAFSGYILNGSWIITREMRTYNRRNGTIGSVPVSRSVNQGGPGAWEITARYSYINLNDAMVSGGEMDILSLGLNWWATSKAGLSLNYRNILLDRDDILGRSSGLMARIVLILE